MINVGGYDGIYTTSAVSHYLSTHLYQMAKTHFNPIVPPLTLDYAAKKIMHGILVCVLLFLYLFYLYVFYLDKSKICLCTTFLLFNTICKRYLTISCFSHSS